MRVLGLDIGDRRIGVAISDPEEILASPLVTIARDNDEDAINAIIRLVHQRKAKPQPAWLGNFAQIVASFVDMVLKHVLCSIFNCGFHRPASFLNWDFC